MIVFLFVVVAVVMVVDVFGCCRGGCEGSLSSDCGCGG